MGRNPDRLGPDLRAAVAAPDDPVAFVGNTKHVRLGRVVSEVLSPVDAGVGFQATAQVSRSSRRTSVRVAIRRTCSVSDWRQAAAEQLEGTAVEVGAHVVANGGPEHRAPAAVGVSSSCGTSVGPVERHDLRVEDGKQPRAFEVEHLADLGYPTCRGAAVRKCS